MLDHLKTGRQGSTISQGRLGTYMAMLLVLGFGIWGATRCGGSRTPTEAEQPADEPAEKQAPRLVVDLEQLPAADDEAEHTRYDLDGLKYLFGIADRSPVDDPRRLTPEALEALPFAEGRGQVFITHGKVVDVVREEFLRENQRLWSVVVQGKDGGRVVVLHSALGSDSHEGRPEDAHVASTEYIEPGDDVYARGIYLQRRTGTIGDALIREPVPVLVAAPPEKSFRKTMPRAVEIEDPTEADWDDVKDMFLRDTQKWQETAFFQVAEWARRVGHAKILEDIRSGALPTAHWGQKQFVAWSEEVDVSTADAPRPVTNRARGRLFTTKGLFARFVKEGWDAVPRNRWHVDTLYMLDLMSDEYGNEVLRCLTPFPVKTFEGVTGKAGQHLRFYGYFLKNYTYEKDQVAEAGRGTKLLTIPLFIVVHIEPVEARESPYERVIQYIVIAMALLGILFYFVLMRSDRKDADSMQERRAKMRRRRFERDVSEGSKSRGDAAPEDGAETGDAPTDPPADEP